MYFSTGEGDLGAQFLDALCAVHMMMTTYYIILTFKSGGELQGKWSVECFIWWHPQHHSTKGTWVLKWLRFLLGYETRHSNEMASKSKPRGHKVCGCCLVCFSMFSNLYRLDLHKRTCVALRWDICKNRIENRASVDLVMVLGSAGLLVFVISYIRPPNSLFITLFRCITMLCGTDSIPWNIMNST